MCALGDDRKSSLGWSHWVVRTIFCPPGPVPFRNTSVNSSSGMGPGRGGIGRLAHVVGDDDRLCDCPAHLDSKTRGDCLNAARRENKELSCILHLR